MGKAALKLVIAVACIGIGIFLGNHWSSEANTNQSIPGSIDDPVVTKSYVDQALKESGAGGSAAASLEVVVVPLGKMLIAKQEGTEFVVRSGKALTYSADKDGISDLTDGADITNGKAVANNHLILSPRIGRGIAPDPTIQTNRLIVLVKGSYELK